VELVNGWAFFSQAKDHRIHLLNCLMKKLWHYLRMVHNKDKIMGKDINSWKSLQWVLIVLVKVPLKHPPTTIP